MISSCLHPCRPMSFPNPTSPSSDVSEVLDSVFPDSKGPASDRARLRELRELAQNEGLGVAAHYPAVTAEMLFPSVPAKRRRVSSPDHPPTFYERIDTINQALEKNGLTLSEFVRTTCTHNYAAERARSEPGFQLYSGDAQEAENVRNWAKEIARYEVLRQAKQMETQHLFHTGSKCYCTLFVQCCRLNTHHVGNATTIDWLNEWSPDTVYQHMSRHMPDFVLLLEAFIRDTKSKAESKKEDVSIVSIHSPLPKARNTTIQ